jgi:hypothetical protein
MTAFMLSGKNARGDIVVEALNYKLEGRGFDSRGYQWIFH